VLAAGVERDVRAAAAGPGPDLGDGRRDVRLGAWHALVGLHARLGPVVIVTVVVMLARLPGRRGGGGRRAAGRVEHDHRAGVHAVDRGVDERLGGARPDLGDHERRVRVADAGADVAVHADGDALLGAAADHDLGLVVVVDLH